MFVLLFRSFLVKVCVCACVCGGGVIVVSLSIPCRREDRDVFCVSLFLFMTSLCVHVLFVVCIMERDERDETRVERRCRMIC